jgi:hypothetical protein
MKEAAVKKGLPKRGRFAWNAFFEGHEQDKIEDIEKALGVWMANIDAI